MGNTPAVSPSLRRTGRQESVLEILFKLTLLIVWPVGAFIFSLLRPGARSSYAVYFIVGLLFAWNMEFQGGGFFDIVGIVRRFYAQQHMSTAELQELFVDFFNGEANKKDLYNTLINWITQQFSDSYHLMYVIAGIPYLFLMLGSVHAITSNPKFRAGITGLLVLLLFVLPKDIFSLQNFRFSTATWLSIYILIRYFSTGKNKYAIWLFLTPLIHSSFFFLCVIFLGYLALRYSRLGLRFVPTFFLCSIPFAFLDSSYLSLLNISLIPEYLRVWAQSYLSDNAAEAFGTFSLTDSRFYLLCTVAKIFTYSFGGILLLRYHKSKSMGPRASQLVMFYLLFAAVTYYCQFIPVLGSRFWDVSRILFIFVWFTIVYPQKMYMLWLILGSCAYELAVSEVDHYSRIVAPDFWFSNFFALL